MADNYTQATVFPEIYKGLFTKDEIRILSENGYTVDNPFDGDYLYLYIEEGFDFEETAYIFQKVIRRSQNNNERDPINEIIIEGAFTCSKLRSGEFGGFAARITIDDIQEADTSYLIDLMRKGSL